MRIVAGETRQVSSRVPSGITEEAERFGPAIRQAVGRVLASGSIILGPEVAAFEEEFAAFVGSVRAVGVASGTDALTLSLRALDLTSDDEVIMPANAVPTLFGVARAGVRVRFADVDPDTFVMTADSVRAVLSSRTRCVVAVHLYGQPVDVSSIRNEIGLDDVKIVEDCAQAHGAHVGLEHVGNAGDLSAWSFYPTKNLGAAGDAGAISTNDHGLADRIKRLRQYGEVRRYYSEEFGYNSRLDEIQAAILRAKLPYLTSLVDRRRELADLYIGAISSRWRYQVQASGTTNARHLFPIMVPQRDFVFEHLTRLGVPVGQHYPLGAHHQQPVLQATSTRDACPVVEDLSRHILTLPINPYLSDNDVTLVCEWLSAAVAQAESQ